jgi:2,4-didehydro-3-deoxy-L-rhamnonate hydrolase
VKLATVSVNGRQRVVGLVGQDRLVDVAGLSERKGLGPAGFPRDMLELINAGWLGKELVKRVEDLAQQASTAETSADLFYSVSDILWKAPIPHPGKMPFVFANGRFDGKMERIDPESGGRFPRPLYFLKSPSSIIAHQEPILINEDMGITQPEAELAVIIGQRARCIRAEQALDYIYGYSVFDDVTGAGLSWQDGRRTLAPSKVPGKFEEYYTRPMARFKGVDSWGPFGPYIVPKEQVAHIEEATVYGRLNGKVVLQGQVGEYHFSIGECVATISECMTLEPGDVISVGTVPPTEGRSLREINLTNANGGTMEIEVTGIGILTNPIKVLPPLWPECPPARTTIPIK